MWKWFVTGADPGFQVGGHIKKLRLREHFWDISCEKSRFYAKKSCFSILGGDAGCVLNNVCRFETNYVYSINGGGAFPISRSIELFLSLFVIRGNGPNEYQMIYFN